MPPMEPMKGVEWVLLHMMNQDPSVVGEGEQPLSRCSPSWPDR